MMKNKQLLEVPLSYHLQDVIFDVLEERTNSPDYNTVSPDITAMNEELTSEIVEKISPRIEKELSTLQSQHQAELEKVKKQEPKSVPMSILHIALCESLKINVHFGRRLNYPNIKIFRSVSNWLEHLKKANAFSDEAITEFNREIQLLTHQQTNKVKEE